MKALGFLVGIPVAILTWYLTVMIAGGVMLGFGLHPDMYGVAPFAVIIAGPWLGIVAWRRTIRYFEHLEREEARRRLEAECRREGKIRQEQEKRALSVRLSQLLDNSRQTAAELPTLVQKSESSLDYAAVEFEERAFAPFWDAVEDAANSLARFDANVQYVISKSHQYKAESSGLDAPPPPFQIGVNVLPDASRTADRMRGIVRRAQKDFQFATIYEQRKTNQLLVAGFSSFGHAINELSERLNTSLQDLSESIAASLSDVASSHREVASQLAGELQLSRELTTEDSKARREHEQQQRDLLEKLQRRSNS